VRFFGLLINMSGMKYKSTLLIVDDDKHTRDSIEALLIKEGYKLVFAANGQEAIKKAKKVNPDLILLDVMMPGMDGFEVCTLLRADNQLSEVPIILVTTLDDRDSRIRGIKSGADDFISKPFDRIEMRTRIRSIIRLNRYRRLLDERSEKELIKNQRDKIEAQRDEIEAQRNLATFQRDRIASQKMAITDSIIYAGMIQKAMMVPEKYISELLPEYFVLNKPKDIVSGDFFWLTRENNKIILAVADCTGHGVPGAFMSILGISFLREIVNGRKNICPDEILNELRRMVISALHQTVESGESMDGIDIALCSFNLENRELQFAGANNPLYLIRDGELTIIKADKMPVGIFFKGETGFSNHEIKLEENDSIYMFSDGYADQFGGPNGKKFMLKHFQQLLCDIHKKPMKEQKEILDRTIEEWKSVYEKQTGSDEQIDDILVFGLRF